MKAKDLLVDKKIVSMLLSSFLVLTLIPYTTPEADAYTRFSDNRKWCVTVDVYNATTGSYTNTVNKAQETWNMLPAGIRYYYGSSTGYEIKVENANYGSTSWAAAVFWNSPASTNGCINPPITIKLNQFFMDGYSYWKNHAVIAHEFGHTLGLDHSSVQTSLLYSALSTIYDTHKIYVPVLDDLRGAKTIYGSEPTPPLSTHTNGGTVTFGNNPYPYPIQVKVTTAGAGKYAYFKHSTLTNLNVNEVNTVLVDAKPNTKYRFSAGINTSTDPSSVSSRFGTCEMDNDGFKLVYTKTDNKAGVVALTSTTGESTIPSILAEYEIIFVAQKVGTAPYLTCYVFRTSDGGYIGYANKDSIGLKYGWSQSPVYHGAGVWTDSSTNPASDYTVNRFALL